MKLIKCYISAFGKFRDFAIDFSDGLNSIVHENGWGKSTLASFIKCVFYGINSKKRNIEENDRIKYAPWNYNEKFGGYVVFEKDGYEIKAERYFGKKESDDTLTLTDIKTGKLFACPENLGEHIFKIDEEGFTSTLFFIQNDLEVKDTSSLSSKFNMADPSDTKAFEQAKDKLEKKIKEYLNSANRGIITDLKNKQYSINEKIEQAKLADSTLENVKYQEKETKEQIKIVTEKINQINKDLKIASTNAVNKEKSENLKLLKTKQQNLQSELSICKQSLNDNDLQKQDLDKYFNCVKDLSLAKERQSVLKEYVSSQENVQTLKTNKTSNLIICLITVLFAVLGGILAWFSIVPAVVLFVVSFFGIAYSSYKFATEKKNRTKANPLLDRQKKEYEEFTEIIVKQTDVLEAFFSKFNLDAHLDYYQKIEALREALAKVDALSRELVEIERQITSYNNVDLTVNSNVSSLEELEKELTELQRQYSALTTELSRINTSVLRYEELSYSLTDLVNEKMQIQDKIEIAVKNNDLLKTTLKYLNQADENLKILYREPLSNALNNYISILSDTVNSLNIDIDLNVSINEKSGTKNTKYYSLGYQNLFEICKRFALIDVLYKDNLPFVVLDDPFTNLDQEKITASLDLIKKLSNSRQIIYLTCHKSRAF